MEKTKECILYVSDIEAFINLSLIKLESTYSPQLRTYLFRVLKQLTFYDDYYKTRYKIDELEEILECYEDCEDVSDENRILAQKIIENIRNH